MIRDGKKNGRERVGDKGRSDVQGEGRTVHGKGTEG